MALDGQDKGDMVAIVAHLTRIAMRKREQQLHGFKEAIPQLVSAMCHELDLDHLEVGHLAKQQALAMGGVN